MAASHVQSDTQVRLAGILAGVFFAYLIFSFSGPPPTTKPIEIVEEPVDEPVHTQSIVSSSPSAPMWPGGATTSWRFPADMPFLEALSTCESVECIHDAHKQPRGEAIYRYPHFIIGGWPKCATSSTYQLLSKHPGALNSSPKEPALFYSHCVPTGDKFWCDEEKSRNYTRNVLKMKEYLRSKGQMAPFEATPNYVPMGRKLAPAIYRIFPWVKMIASLREPISREMSGMIMLYDRGTGCMREHNMSYCIIDRISDGDIERRISNYARHIKSYAEVFPSNQLLFLQYEDLTGDETSAAELRRLKEFVDLNPNLPRADLTADDQNCRKCRINPQGWEMKREVYQKLVDNVQRDVGELMDHLKTYNLGDPERWMKNWRAVWQKNLDSCDDKTGMCMIKLS